MKNTVICLLLFGISLTASAQEKVETVSMRYETQNDMPLFYQKMKENLTYPNGHGGTLLSEISKSGVRKLEKRYWIACCLLLLLRLLIRK
mgnify:CR=1 FL=1